MIKLELFPKTSSLPPSFLTPRVRHRSCFFTPRRRSLRNATNPRIIRFVRKNNNIKVLAVGNMSAPADDWSGFSLGENQGDERSYLPVELCMSHELPPAVTMRDALAKMREAVAELKADPPCSRSGVVRFEIRVPPSIKAVDWVLQQDSSSSLTCFPRFCVSAKNNKKSIDLSSLDGMLGVSGIGAAIFFRGSSSTLTVRNLKRYLSIDLPQIRAYGFLDTTICEESSLMDNYGTFDIFVPQIELNEFDGCSLLASTVIWDDYACHNFEAAIISLELHLCQIVCRGQHPSTLDNDIQRSDSIQVKDIQMVWLNAENLSKWEIICSSYQLEQLQSQNVLYFRLSTGAALTNNMVNSSSGLSISIMQYPNINAVWAAAIVEECVRLGLTYFCIAPGSRSSPLAISAASHPFTTCISCFDERSLAFHAVGYGRGSGKPAVVITSSGTAVSNLLPAVVESFQDSVPLLLLTADRPPEAHGIGANQAIDQVNHFGHFVRFFFSLPPPSDVVPARMVLTTIDSAVYNATQEPCGPAHINCPFREPLDDLPSRWMVDCLQGLSYWLADSKPFTEYINAQSLFNCDGPHDHLSEVMKIIQTAERGLLFVGAIKTEDEVWAALLLAKHLAWPVISDVLSGLRLRKFLTLSPKIDDQILFIDHLDHALLSDQVRGHVRPDVVLQLGTRITSKRVAQQLECSFPHKYILVDKNPCRHDPSHLVTHRIQSGITVFCEALLKIEFTKKKSNWSIFLLSLETMVARELLFQIHMEDTLTEPYVAHVMPSALQHDSVLFLGNSMVIRDMDMYGMSPMAFTSGHKYPMLSQDLPYGMRVAGNRGASGIDGLLSSAIGYGVGCNKRVICMIGDVSFLHDTNGLAILKDRMHRKPIAILVVNNHGGAIFSLLPVAERTDPSILKKFFYTEHDISIGKLCEAHCVDHLYIRTKLELEHVLSKFEKSDQDCVIEVESSILGNSNFHSILRKSACQAANKALSFLLASNQTINHVQSSFCNIYKMEYSFYRIKLFAPLTTTSVINEVNDFYREGFVLKLTLTDGSVGFGEVAPIDIQKENLEDVEGQLGFLVHVIEGSHVDLLFPSLGGSFSSWFWCALGIKPSSLFPSVRCAVEMALLNTIANGKKSTLADALAGSQNLSSSTQSHSVTTESGTMERSEIVQICALVDCTGTSADVCRIVSQLADEGFTTVKLKVARRANPSEDAAIIQEIREKLGYEINIRVDANRNWTYEQAVQFGSYIKNFRLQYIEEPVQSEEDIIKFCEETGLPIALDETLTNSEGDSFLKIKQFVHPGIVAVVIKPMVVGGFENAALIARWAHQHEKMVIISSAFESSLGLCAYIQFAHYLELERASLYRIKERNLGASIAHGLGTYKWLKEDVTNKPLRDFVHRQGDTVGVSMEDAALMQYDLQINEAVIKRSFDSEFVRSYWSTIESENFSCSLKLLELKTSANDTLTIFIHGFLGTSEEWLPLMRALSTRTWCVAVDLPGHGESRIEWKNVDEDQRPYLTVEAVGDILHKLLCDITVGRIVLVGYSMGARVALYMSLKYKYKIDGAVLISGSPGLKKESLRKDRVAQDDAKAKYLSVHGLPSFVDIWYRSELWTSLRNHPNFKQISSSRWKHLDTHAVAMSLSGMSVGRQQPLWGDLKQSEIPLLLIVGENDTKYREIAEEMSMEIVQRESQKSNELKKLCFVVEVPESGHAVHLENPLAVVHEIRKFLRSLHVG